MITNQFSFGHFSCSMKQFFFILGVLSIASLATSSPNGAPLAACNTQMPNHGLNVAQTSASPIRIVLSQTRIRPGQTINIRIENISSIFQFRGFMIQPRNVVAPNNLVGTMNTNGDDSQIINCSGQTTATHVNRELKSSVSVNWTAPQMVGGVRIQWVFVLASVILVRNIVLKLFIYHIPLNNFQRFSRWIFSNLLDGNSLPNNRH